MLLASVSEISHLLPSALASCTVVGGLQLAQLTDLPCALCQISFPPCASCPQLCKEAGRYH